MEIRDLLAYLGIEYREAGTDPHVRAGNVGIPCLLCSPGKFKLSIHLHYLWATCWTCGRQRLGEILSNLSGRPLKEILKLLPERGRLDPLPVDNRVTGTYTPPPGVGDMLPVHRKYLERRGIDPTYAEEVWKVQGIGGDGGDLKWRLFLPAMVKQKPVSWTTRAVGNDPRRYRAADPARERVALKSLLFGADLCRHAVCVVESPLTAIWAGPGFAAVSGTAITPAQILKISQYPVRVIALDREGPAQATARRLLDTLSIHPGETYNVVTSAKSVDESPLDEVREIRSRFLT